MTFLGAVEYNRSRYRPSNSRRIIPTKHLSGLVEGDLTQAAAGLSMIHLGNLTARESADFWERITGFDQHPLAADRRSGTWLKECFNVTTQVSHKGNTKKCG